MNLIINFLLAKNTGKKNILKRPINWLILGLITVHGKLLGLVMVNVVSIMVHGKCGAHDGAWSSSSVDIGAW